MANYIEYIILPKDISCNASFVDYSFDHDHFINKMSTMVYKNAKYYERKIKQYVRNDLYYEVVLDHKNDIADIRSYVKSCTDYEFVQPNVIKMQYTKQKKPVHAFSSSLDINDVLYIKRLTFRISNRIFVNFEIGASVADITKKYRKVYINGNFDADVDHDYINTELQQYLTLLS